MKKINSLMIIFSFGLLFYPISGRSECPDQITGQEYTLLKEGYRLTWQHGNSFTMKPEEIAKYAKELSTPKECAYTINPSLPYPNFKLEK